MVLTTKEASYIIVLGIVISVLPISSTGSSGFPSDVPQIRWKHWEEYDLRMDNGEYCGLDCK